MRMPPTTYLAFVEQLPNIRLELFFLDDACMYGGDSAVAVDQ
jgi:hypothetical protein